MSSARARAAGGNVSATYALPSMSPRSPSVAARQRFQRGSGSCAPERSLLNRKSSSENARVSVGAASRSVTQRR